MIDVHYLVYAMIAVAVAMGAQAAFQYLSGTRSYRRSVNRRLKIIGQIGETKDSLVELRRRRSLSPEGRYILPIIWFNRLVMQSGVSLNAKPLLMLMVGLAVASYGVAYILSRSLVLSGALALVIGFGIPLQFLRISRSRRIRRFESQLPDGIDTMVRGLRAGHPVPAALSTVAREAPDPVGSEFGMAFDEVTYGLDVETAMANMRARVGQGDLALLVVAVSLQSKTGGNLAEILASLSNVLRERFKMQRKVRALSAEGRFSAIGLSVLPFFVSSAIFMTAPTFYTVVWDDPLFMPVMIISGFLLLIGDYIMYRMVDFGGDGVSNPPMIMASLGDTQLLVVIGAAVFGGVFFMSMAVARVLSARSAIRQRALKDFALAGILEDSSGAWLDRRSVSYQTIVRASRIILAAATKFGPSDKRSKATMRVDMVKSGFFDASALYWYYSARVLCAVTLPIVFLLAVQFLPYSFSATWMIVAVVSLGLTGYVLPGFYLRRRQIRLQQQFRHGFPDFMDLMVVCAESGISPAAAIDRVGRELAVTYPYLGANLHLVTLELRAGQALTTAMKNLGDRVGLEEVNSLAGLLKQSEELGTSLADALRVYSLEMRDKRLSRAEEKAHALPVVLMLPLGLFIFPVMMISIMLPLLLRFKAVFF